MWGLRRAVFFAGGGGCEDEGGAMGGWGGLGEEGGNGAAVPKWGIGHTIAGDRHMCRRFMGHQRSGHTDRDGG